MTQEKDISKAFIQVEKGASDFKMTGCEFITEGSDRPIIQTKAKNTVLVDNLISSTKISNPSSNSQEWYKKPLGQIGIGVAIIIIGAGAIYIIKHYLAIPL